VVQGAAARPHLVRGLRAAGFDVRVATLYDTRTRPWSDGLEVDAVVLASPSAVRALPQGVGERALVVAIGPTTAAAARDRGFDPLTADAPTVAAVAERLKAARPPAEHGAASGAPVNVPAPVAPRRDPS
jgi:uroporphyrinogen-III synthase